jgi:uncharacterized protein YdeI (YjbR/CyaY-like superfamily)
MEIYYFKSADEFREWLFENHAEVKEKWLGFYKKNSKLTGITYKEAVDQALCFGWIDGVTHKVDENSYTVRFTPRKTKSYWSQVNIKRMEELLKLGLVQPSGLIAYHRNNQKELNLYPNEGEPRQLSEEYLSKFQENPKAWEFFQTQAPSYRKIAIYFVMSAKQEETRQRRLDKVIAYSEKGERIPEVPGSRKTPQHPKSHL